MKAVMVWGARCSDCGEELTPWLFTGGWTRPDFKTWPIPCHEVYAQRELRHPKVEPWNGCGGRLLLLDAEIVETRIMISVPKLFLEEFA
jgi:hypothetical protein